jgi:hypothetical protein
MRTSNYDQMRDQMERHFLDYSQEEIIRKYALSHDADYLYLSFIGRPYRISRTTGRTEWSEDGFQTPIHADYNETMTIFDVLCYAKENCHLSGNFVTLDHLKGIVHTAVPGRDLFQAAAKQFAHRTESLNRACIALGGEKMSVGDISYKLNLFDFLPVILQFWDADEEFDPVLKLMWDESILSYMHFETTFFAASHLWKRLTELSGL